MLHPEKVLAALQGKRARFGASEAARQEDLDALAEALEAYEGLSLTSCQARLAEVEWPGARPTPEKGRHRQAVLPFAERWSNHREARAWALEILQGVPVFAVDGSQITPSRDLSIPVAVVQVGWFENRHLPGGDYVKDVAVEVLTPDELGETLDDGDGFPDWPVNWRRFQMEVDRLIGYMQSHDGAGPKPLCFFDGSLVVSFAGLMAPERQRRYTETMSQLLEASEESQVPLVGYVDNSLANDLSEMLTHLTGVKPGGRVSDAAVLRGRMRWGDRTQAFVCARNDNVRDKYYDHVGFAYLKTSGENSPARVEFPRWMVEAGEHVRALDLVRAECVVGTGYPYALETADAVATLTVQDRERFYRLFQEFAGQEGLSLRLSRKSVSKRGRRV